MYAVTSVANYFKRPKFWGVIVIFVILLGIFLARVVAPYQRTEHFPDWGQAQWITSTNANAVTYYRKSFSINSSADYASIMLSATDSADVYVNGRFRQHLERVSTAVYDAIDVGQYLLPGENTIAIRVECKTLNSAPGLIAKLRWRDAIGSQQELVSDTTWRVSQREERQNNGQLAWYEAPFDDLSWHQAAELGSKQDLMLYVEHPWATSELFSLFPRGVWMWEGETGVNYTRDFDLGTLSRGDIKSAWLGVASTVPYVIVINGARGPAIAPSSQYMDTYNIGDFLFAGRNTITIDVSAEDAGGRLAVAAIVQKSDQLIDLSSNDQWRARGIGQKPHSATSLGSLSSYPYVDNVGGQVFRLPVVRLSNLAVPGGLLLRHILSAWPWILGVFLLVLTVIGIGSAFRAPSEVVAKAGMLPWILADLLLLIAFLLPFDVRITGADVFNLPVALVLSILPLALFVLILIETAGEHKNIQ